MTLIRFIGDWDAAMERGKRSLAAHLLRNGYQFDVTKFMTVFGERLLKGQKTRLNDHVERPTQHLLREVMAEFGYPDLPDEIVENSMQQFYAESETYWIPIPSSTKVLNELRGEGYHLGMISNAGDENNVLRLITKANLENFFHPILISAAEGIRKPDVRLFNKVLEMWDLTGGQVVMVGDTLEEDIMGAQSAGIHQIWMKENVDTLDNQNLAEKLKPEVIASTLTDIPNLIRNLSLNKNVS
jgi:HAD superfamily hydrolase (TIGR01549 family)